VSYNKNGVSGSFTFYKTNIPEACIISDANPDKLGLYVFSSVSMLQQLHRS